MFGSISLHDGNPVAYIKGGSYHGHGVRIQGVDKEDDAIKEFTVPDDDAVIMPFYTNQMMPDGTEFPNRYVVAGPSLCGKTYFARQLAEDYMQDYPENRVVLFTAIPKEKDQIFACDECRFQDFSKRHHPKAAKCFCSKIYRIALDEDQLLNNPIDLDELSNSIVILDDVSRHPSKAMVDYCNALRDRLFKSGRHDNISVVSVDQILLQGSKTKTANVNASAIVSFPRTLARFELGNYLDRYLHFKKPMIDKILAVPSRWVLINLLGTMYCLHERGCFIL